MKQFGDDFLINPIMEKYSIDRSIIRKLINEYRIKNIECMDDNNLQDCYYSDLEDDADALFCKLIDFLRKKLSKTNIVIDLSMNEYKYHYDAIAYEILNILDSSSLYRFTQADFEAMEEFLATPRGKELEGWAKWEEYWKKREEE